MKRSLVLLLVVAMLAVMIPSVALADTPTTASIALSPDSLTKNLMYYDDEEDTTDYEYGWTVATVSDVKDASGQPVDYEYVYYDWEIANGNVAYFSGSTSGYFTVSSYMPSRELEAPFMRVYNKVGETKATLNLYSDSTHSTLIKSASLDIKVTSDKTEKIEVDKQQPASSFEMTMDDASKWFGSVFTVTPATAYYGKNFKWSISGDSSVAIVDKYGYVKPLKTGEFTLVATARDNPDAKAETKITVNAGKDKPVETPPTLTFTASQFTVKSNDYLRLDDYLEKDNFKATDEIYWTSSDPKVISIDKESASGVITKKQPGTVTITARSMLFPTATATCTVTYEKEALKTITITNAPSKIDENSDDDVYVWDYVDTDPAYYATSYKNEIGWKSSDPQVAYVSAGGTLYGRKVGTATITAYSKDDETVAAKFDVTVEAVPVTDIIFSKDTYTVKVNGEYGFSRDKDYRFAPKNYSDGFTTKWTSSDEDVATMEGNYIYGHKVGTATITLSVRNANDTIVTKDITVNVVENTLTGIAFKKEAYTVPLSYRKNTKSVALKLTPADANFDADDLYVESSDQKVATANLDGSEVDIWAIAPGTATITVKSHSNEALTASTTVTVKPVNLTGVKMVQDEKTVPIYKDADNELMTSSVTLKAAVEPSDAYCKAVWETSDASVAYPAYDEENEGRRTTLYAVGPGTCTISVTATDGTNTFTASMKVTVKVATVSKFELNVTKATVYMVKGEDNTLELKATDVNTGDAVPVKWSTSNKKIATVDQKGVVTFKKAGKVKITATTRDGNDTQKTCTLTIKQLKVSKISVSKAVTLNVGQEKALEVTIKPAKVYNPALSFKSSKPKVVSVDAEGNLKALAPGKSVITITAKDGSKKTAKVTVTVKAGSANNELTVDGNIDDGMDLTIDGDVLGDFGGISQNEIGGAIELTIE